MSRDSIESFVRAQLAQWPLASDNFSALESTRTKDFQIFDVAVRAQFNPCRIKSSTAEVDADSIAARKCFLCAANEPAEQRRMPFQGLDGRKYNIQVNPFPIFRNHLVVPSVEHTPQLIGERLPDMLEFVSQYPEFTVFYNGPFSGASAPDHFHFQACLRGELPLELAVDSDRSGRVLVHRQDSDLILPGFSYANGLFVIRGSQFSQIAELFRILCDCCGVGYAEQEPRYNIFCWRNGGVFSVAVMLRTSSRSHHYYAQGAEHLTMSPGAADVAGVFIVPCGEDFRKLTSEMLCDMLAEVTVDRDTESKIVERLVRRQPLLDVGIMLSESIEFELPDRGVRGEVSVRDGRLLYEGRQYDELNFGSPECSTLYDSAAFILHSVQIGIDFHWQQNRDLSYCGGLRFVVEDGKVRAINRIGIENYLLSVISSEMKSSASLQLLKAHAVISRSWVMARMRDFRDGAPDLPHSNFVVCADDHCQRYQGVGMAQGENVRMAIDQTWGQVLSYNGQICDARYSKCCGGVTEIFSSCWQDVDFPYLQSFPDTSRHAGMPLALVGAVGAVPQIDDVPFCSCKDARIMSQVLNDYDLQTEDFFQWTERRSGDEFSQLLRERTGVDYGRIVALEPLRRGPSGRIVELRVVGSLRTGVIGKELAIRRALSPSHLKSSLFDITVDGEDIVLKGRGWGHGVGLCQIGAAVMASRGYTYRQILSHYYPNTLIVNDLTIKFKFTDNFVSL